MLVPADKAAQNVIVVCKMYYLEVVLKETETTAIYETAMMDGQSIFNKHCKYFLDATLIYLHSIGAWLYSIGFQSFINGHMGQGLLWRTINVATTKPLSRLLTSSLKLISKHYKQYCNRIFRKTGVNCFWIIDNSQQVL